MADTPPPPPSSAPAFSEGMARLGRWCREQPVQAALLGVLLGTLVYFFVFLRAFSNGTLSTLQWAWQGWNEENDLQHGPLILPAAAVVAWMHRDLFRRATKTPSWVGLLAVLAGILVFVAAVWMLQPRIALLALPLLIFGGVLFTWGWPTARLAIFPCLFLLFMIPLGFLLGQTEPLQRLVASIVGSASNLVGVGVEREGVKLIAIDRSFQCEVAGGCSGVRSLMAMAMLSALYGHFTLHEGWKKVLLCCMSLPFAVVGNVARVFTIVLASKLFGQEIGTGPWHDISGFIVTIPIAVSAMIAFANLLQRDWTTTKANLLKPDQPARAGPGGAGSSGPISYDY